jgi:hypothetical protein
MWKVQIISMSFGFAYDDENMKEAIRAATGAGVLIFAAASGYGHYSPAFPARYSHVICVNAFNYLGIPIDLSSLASEKYLGTLGFAVPGMWPGHEGPKAVSGTSVATPILAGIAALSIQFVRQSVEEPPPSDGYDQMVWQKIEHMLQERDGMILMLELFTNSISLGRCFVYPQIYFKSRASLHHRIWYSFRDRIASPTANEDESGTSLTQDSRPESSADTSQGASTSTSIDAGPPTKPIYDQSVAQNHARVHYGHPSQSTIMMQDISESSKDVSRRAPTNSIIGAYHAPRRHYKHTTAQEYARQHNGDQYFYGPVSYQDTVSVPPAANLAGVELEELSRVLESLVFDRMDSSFMNVHKPLVGTCEWLSHTPEYAQWRDNSTLQAHRRFLWIKGEPGTGKSTLIKHAVDVAEADPVEGECVLVFFCSCLRESIESTAEGLFRSMLHQMLEKTPRLFNLLDKRRLKFAKRQGWSLAVLRDVFRDAVLRLDENRVTCYINGIDHSSDSDSTIQFFEDLGGDMFERNKRLYVCWSSGLYQIPLLNRSIQMMLQCQQGHRGDIQMYIAKRLMLDGESLVGNLAQMIEEKASGRFDVVMQAIMFLNEEHLRCDEHEILERLKRFFAR